MGKDSIRLEKIGALVQLALRRASGERRAFLHERTLVGMDHAHAAGRR